LAPLHKAKAERIVATGESRHRHSLQQHRSRNDAADADMTSMPLETTLFAAVPEPQ